MKNVTDNNVSSFWQKPFAHALIIALVGLFVYSETFSVPFLFDDASGISENPLVKDLKNFLSIEGFKNNISNTRFIGYLSFAINYKIHGVELAGYHAVNLVIHIINALLVYYLIIFSFRTPVLKDSLLKHRTRHIAFFAALLFVCHPIQTQAVTYIVQRFASLAALFYLLSVVLYVKWRLDRKCESGSEKSEDKESKSSWLWYAGALLSAVLAMKTKEISFTLPVAIAVYEFMFFEEKSKKRILFLVPFIVTMLIIPFSMINLNKPVGSIMDDVDTSTRVQTLLSRPDYLFTQVRVIMTYIRLFFFPINQNLDYDYPPSHSLFEPEVFMSLLFLAAIVSVSIYLLVKSGEKISERRLISFGIF
ncbi:MAG: hypothetical protein EPN22_04240 [Nitrospirae bacterium]|nr:MAG: hypothetical protein EPN22_04240 [Nitrospirota bacterium]